MKENIDIEDTEKGFLENLLSKFVSDGTYAVLLFSLSVSLGILNIADKSNTYDIALFFFSISILIAIAYFSARGAKNKISKMKEVFKRLPQEDITEIPRVDEAKKLADIIYNSKDFFHVFTGSSGSGKSIFIKNYFVKEYKELSSHSGSFKEAPLNLYDNADVEESLIKSLEETKIKEIFVKCLTEVPSNDKGSDIDELDNKERILIILDQFESVFLQKGTAPSDHLKNLCNIFKTCKNINEKYKQKVFDCIVIIRKEYFFYLKFFENYIPHIKEVHVMEGFDLGKDIREVETKLESSLKKFHFSEEIYKQIINLCIRTNFNEAYYITSCEKAINSAGNEIHFDHKIILPVELMTVAESVFIDKENHGGIYSENYTNNKQLALSDFFGNYSKTYESFYDVYRVLFALSVAPRSRRFLTPSQISSFINIPYERVIKILRFYSTTDEVPWRNPLLRQVNDEYDWRHDFYAEKFNEISGSVLDPIDRDNISFFFSKKTTCRKSTTYTNQPRYEKFGTLLFLGSFGLLLLRTFYPLILQLSLSPRLQDYFMPFINYKSLIPFAKNIDFSFLPIFISLTLWSWYVTTLYRRLFSQLNEKEYGFGWILSQFVTILSFICVVLSIIYPIHWLTFTGIGGLFIGLKYLQITTKLSKKSKSVLDIPTFTNLWIETIINSVVVILIGSLFYVRLFPPNSLFSEANVDAWGFIVTVFCFCVMVWFSYISIKDHTKYNRIPKLLGIYKRYSSD